MPKPVLNNLTCKSCGGDVTCSKCQKPADGFTEFSDWIRKNGHSRANVQNLDYLYCPPPYGWFITIEEKRHGRRPSASQSALHNILKQMLEVSSGSSVYDSYSKKRLRITYRGHFAVSFEKTTPDDSTWCIVNGKRYTNAKRAVENLLKTGSPTGVYVMPRDLAVWNILRERLLKHLPVTLIALMHTWSLTKAAAIHRIESQEDAA